ncbi:MAG: ATP-binding protein [Chloroflexota bacterium]
MLPDFRVRQRDILLEIARDITQELDIEKLLDRILRFSAEMLAGQAGLIALRGETGGWTVSASHGIPPAFLRYLDPLLAEVPDHEDPARFELPEINRLLQRLTRIASLGLLTGVGLPLIARQRVVGVIFIFRSYPGAFSSNDRALLQSFADQTAIAVHNAQLYTQTLHQMQRMDALMDTAADGILIITPLHIIERTNTAFARLYGLPRSKIQGKRHEEIIQWEKIEHGLELEQAEAGGWPLTPQAKLVVDGDLKRPINDPLPVNITYAPLLSTEGTLINIIASVHDLSRYREAEELKRTFISVVSHELKTPVALIKGYVSTLRRDDATWDREVIQDSLQVIEEEADRLNELIDNLLDASRLEAGVLSINLSDISLPQLVERQVKVFRTQTQRHDLVVDFPPDFPIIMGDEERLEQVISNLLSNAIKYTPGGNIQIKGEVRKDHVFLCVSDEGPGIAPGDVPHIFDRFYRAEEVSRTTKGTGLGLYLARAVIEAHGGRIWVDPAYEDGARVCFSLPRPSET